MYKRTSNSQLQSYYQVIISKPYIDPHLSEENFLNMMSPSQSNATCGMEPETNYRHDPQTLQRTSTCSFAPLASQSADTEIRLQRIKHTNSVVSKRLEELQFKMQQLFQELQTWNNVRKKMEEKTVADTEHIFLQSDTDKAEENYPSFFEQQNLTRSKTKPNHIYENAIPCISYSGGQSSPWPVYPVEPGCPSFIPPRLHKSNDSTRETTIESGGIFAGNIKETVFDFQRSITTETHTSRNDPRMLQQNLMLNGSDKMSLCGPFYPGQINVPPPAYAKQYHQAQVTGSVDPSPVEKPGFKNLKPYPTIAASVGTAGQLNKPLLIEQRSNRTIKSNAGVSMPSFMSECGAEPFPFSDPTPPSKKSNQGLLGILYDYTQNFWSSSQEPIQNDTNLVTIDEGEKDKGPVYSYWGFFVTY